MSKHIKVVVLIWHYMLLGHDRLRRDRATNTTTQQ